MSNDDQKKLDISFLPGQSYIWSDRTTPMLALCGGVGSGKTTFAVYWAHRNALRYPGQIQWMCGHTDSTVKNICFKKYVTVLESFHYKENVHFVSRGKNYIKYANGSEVYFMSATAYERWTGVELCAAVLDEPGRYPDGAFNEIAERLRGKPLPNGAVRQLLFSGTPQGLTKYYEIFHPDAKPTGITYQVGKLTKDLIKQTPDGKKKSLHLPTFLNENIDVKNYLERLYDQYGHNESLIKAHVFGEFVPLFEHNCYKISDAVVIDAAPNPDLSHLYLSFDFNVGQMSYITAQQHNGKSYIIEEAKERVADTADACIDFLAKFPGTEWRNKILVVTGDASGHSRDTRSKTSDYDLIEQLLRPHFAAVYIDAPKSNSPVKLRIEAVNKALTKNPYNNSGPVLYFDRYCTRTINSMYQTVYDERGGIRKSSTDTVTHSSDAVGYYVQYAHPFIEITTSQGIAY